jgi:hypothetical protein
VALTYYGTALIEERIANQIECAVDGWKVICSTARWPSKIAPSTDPMEVVVPASVRLLQCALAARSRTKFMPDRDEDSAIANLKDDWQPPQPQPYRLPEVHQYRKHIAALPFGVARS